MYPFCLQRTYRDARMTVSAISTGVISSTTSQMWQSIENVPQTAETPWKCT